MSDDVEHTLAPWEVIAYDRVGHGGKDYTVDMAGWDCRVADIEHSGEIGECNAHLIAAAPELLEAAKHSLDVLTRIKATHEHLLSKELLTELDNAIAKAEGRNE